MTRAGGRRAAALAVVAVVSLTLGGCAEDDDLPDTDDPTEGDEIVPGDEGPVG